MKKIITSLLIACLLFLVPQAQAINKEWSAALGFLGGVLVANAYDNHHTTYYETRPVYVETRCYEPRVISGHYETRYEKYWVPGRQVVVRDRCGNKVVRYESGYYDYRPVSVWIED